jgi:hypothetical protein
VAVSGQDEPPLTFEVVGGGWWWPLEDETNPCSRLRQQGVVVAVRGQDKPPPHI